MNKKRVIVMALGALFLFSCSEKPQKAVNSDKVKPAKKIIIDMRPKNLKQEALPKGNNFEILPSKEEQKNLLSLKELIEQIKLNQDKFINSSIKDIKYKGEIAEVYIKHWTPERVSGRYMTTGGRSGHGNLHFDELDQRSRERLGYSDLLYDSFKFHHWYFEMKSRTGLYALNYEEMKNVLEGEIIPPPEEMDFSKVKIKVEGTSLSTHRSETSKVIILDSVFEVSVRIINKSFHSIFYSGAGGHYYRVDVLDGGVWKKGYGPIYCGTDEFTAHLKAGGVSYKEKIKLGRPEYSYVRIGLKVFTREKAQEAIIWTEPIKLSPKRHKRKNSK